ncbi:GTP-binding protein Di-Ras1-like [Diadema antillarum]|uniref:GTP-binding protein Di-Ras1-like n=1 Tax=Diadema antillarum TaxID=105358 RepID=UPI003A8A6245
MTGKLSRSNSVTKRVVFFGAAQVGKSAIIRHFTKKSFPTHYQPTVEDMYDCDVEYKGMSVRLDILDTAGSYVFPAMRRLALNSGDLFVVVYSSDNRQSYLEALRTCAEITEVRGHDVPIVVVANKTDLTEQTVLRPEAELMFCQWNTFTTECSAADEWRVNRVFDKCLSLMLPCSEYPLELLSSPQPARSGVVKAVWLQLRQSLKKCHLS